MRWPDAWQDGPRRDEEFWWQGGLNGWVNTVRARDRHGRRRHGRVRAKDFSAEGLVCSLPCWPGWAWNDVSVGALFLGPASQPVPAFCHSLSAFDHSAMCVDVPYERFSCANGPHSGRNLTSQPDPLLTSWIVNASDAATWRSNPPPRFPGGHRRLP